MKRGGRGGQGRAGEGRAERFKVSLGIRGWATEPVRIFHAGLKIKTILLLLFLSVLKQCFTAKLLLARTFLEQVDWRSACSSYGGCCVTTFPGRDGIWFIQCWGLNSRTRLLCARQALYQLSHTPRPSLSHPLNNFFKKIYIWGLEARVCAEKR